MANTFGDIFYYIEKKLLKMIEDEFNSTAQKICYLTIKPIINFSKGIKKLASIKYQEFC